MIAFFVLVFGPLFCGDVGYFPQTQEFVCDGTVTYQTDAAPVYYPDRLEFVEDMIFRGDFE